MKSTRARSFMVLIMTLVFFAGLAYYTVKLIMHSAEWASMPMNAHISDTDGLAFAGNIYGAQRSSTSAFLYFSFFHSDSSVPGLIIY